MDGDAARRLLTPRRRQIVRLALLLSFFVWLFVRPFRDGVSMWIPFVAFAGVELQFFVAGTVAPRLRRRGETAREAAEAAEAFAAEERGHRAELDPRARHDLAPLRVLERDGDLVVDDILVPHLEDAGPDLAEPDGFPVVLDPRQALHRAWPYEAAAAAVAIAWVAASAVRVVPGVLVLAAGSVALASFLHRVVGEAGTLPRHRHRLLGHVRTAVALAVVGTVIFLAVRPSGWDALAPAQRAAGEAVFTREASRIAGHPVTVRCDPAGDHTGVRNDAAGAAIVGGRDAWLDPRICAVLYDRAIRARTTSFDDTSWAILVLAHESWHLRGESNEGLANCFGMQSGVELGQRLGLPAGTAARMMRYQYDRNLAEFSLGRGEYQVPPDCRDGARYDLDPGTARFP